jgi:hypothetical protein
MKYIDLKLEGQKYCSALDRYLDENHLPASWFDQGFDHIAIKAYNINDYKELVNHYKGYSELISETDLGGRHIATAQLIGSYGLSLALISVESHSLVANLEIMLARPDDQSDESPRLDHAEVFVERGLYPVRKVLDAKGLSYLDEQNESHEWVSVVFGDVNEVKFTDTRLGDIVADNLRKGTARITHGEQP